MMCNQANFNRFKAKYEKLYEGKASVVRVDSIDTLKTVSVVFCGVLDIFSSTSTSLAGNMIESVGMSTSNCYTGGSTGVGGTSFIGTGSKANLAAELTEWVNKGGKVVVFGNDVGYTTSSCTPTTSAPVGITTAEISILNDTIDMFRNSQRPSNALVCAPDFTGVLCGTNGYRHWNVHSCGGGVVRSMGAYLIDPISSTDDSFVLDNRDETGERIPMFYQIQGSSSGGITLNQFTATYVKWSDGTQSQTSTVRPAAYERYGKGFIIYHGSPRVIVAQGAVISPSVNASCTATITGAGFSGSSVVNQYSFPEITVRNYDGKYWGDVAKFFFWNLLKTCPSCL